MHSQQAGSLHRAACRASKADSKQQRDRRDDEYEFQQNGIESISQGVSISMDGMHQSASAGLVYKVIMHVYCSWVPRTAVDAHVV